MLLLYNNNIFSPHLQSVFTFIFFVLRFFWFVRGQNYFYIAFSYLFSHDYVIIVSFYFNPLQGQNITLFGNIFLFSHPVGQKRPPGAQLGPTPHDKKTVDFTKNSRGAGAGFFSHLRPLPPQGAGHRGILTSF